MDNIIEAISAFKAPKDKPAIKDAASALDIRNADGANDKPAEIFIYDEISWWGVLAVDVVNQIKGISAKEISLRINSPGGAVFEGFAIYNILRQHEATVTTYVDGLAASIASVIALAGDKVVMAENAMFMVHEPWTVAAGNAEDMMAIAAVLEEIGGSIIKTYEARTSLDRETLSDMVAKETWFGADRAVEYGFATEVTEPAQLAAKFDPMTAFDKIPDEAKAILESWNKEPEPDPITYGEASTPLEILKRYGNG